jgi:DmsE family decaheme c-type cytochrome
MDLLRGFWNPARLSAIGLMVVACLSLGMTSCTSSRRPERRTTVDLEPGWPKPNNAFHEVSYGRVQASVPKVEGAEYVNDDELCLTCHEVYAKTFATNVHQGLHEGQSCEACHGPASRHLETRGKEPGMIIDFKSKSLQPAQKAEVCLTCHEENQCVPGARYRYSKHAYCGVACTDCHTAHYNVPPGTPATTEPGAAAYDAEGKPITLTSYDERVVQLKREPRAGTSNNLKAVAPWICYKCHSDMYEFQQVAGPHQICGPNGFNCTTCHDPHGKILEESRVDLCLQCHGQGSPVMAWHSGTHAIEGVACTDCHNPHPHNCVPRFVSISHTNVRSPKRRQMAVEEPEVCYKCHPNIYGLNHLPSHHPIMEGKMVCSDCHDGHGQLEDNLKADRVNDVCWKCHADKQGPFAYEHPPVTENCCICHNPHGTVADHLLKQPPTFLCLRCHAGHRNGTHGNGDRANIDAIPQLRPGLYTDCTTCHSQIHGSDLPTPHFPVYFR